MREAGNILKNSETDAWFLTIYNSEFCDENWSVLTEDMTYEEFADMSDRVFYCMDLRRASEEDEKLNQEKENARNSVR